MHFNLEVAVRKYLERHNLEDSVKSMGT
jgi:hypothetical protein